MHCILSDCNIIQTRLSSHPFTTRFIIVEFYQYRPKSPNLCSIKYRQYIKSFFYCSFLISGSNIEFRQISVNNRQRFLFKVQIFSHAFLVFLAVVTFILKIAFFRWGQFYGAALVWAHWSHFSCWSLLNHGLFTVTDIKMLVAAIVNCKESKAGINFTNFHLQACEYQSFLMSLVVISVVIIITFALVCTFKHEVLYLTSIIRLNLATKVSND